MSLYQVELTDSRISIPLTFFHVSPFLVLEFPILKAHLSHLVCVYVKLYLIQCDHSLTCTVFHIRGVRTSDWPGDYEYYDTSFGFASLSLKGDFFSYKPICWPSIVSLLTVRMRYKILTSILVLCICAYHY